MAIASRRLARSSHLVLALLLCLALPACTSSPMQAADPAGAAKGTEILWDRYGIPHIFAPDHASPAIAAAWSGEALVLRHADGAVSTWS